jgi:two-component system response regulator NreC
MDEGSTTTVLIADDHAVLRDGLRMVLNAEPDISVIGEAEDGRRALRVVEQLQPDVVVMDIAMPGLNGIEATRQIAHRHPTVKVLILTMHENELYLDQIVEAGAIGCVLKRSAGAELVAAVRAAAKGESYFSPALASMMLQVYRQQVAARQTEDPLSDREREVLQLVAEGKTSEEIADVLVISDKTVHTHRAHIMEKLNIHDRAGLVRYAAERGMISLNRP